MKGIAIFCAAGFAALLTVTGQAQAQAPRTFVSGHGEDTNPCTLAAPCRSFAQAITQTNAGGEITVLDSAGYGSLTIDKSITITNPGGVEAGITTAEGQTAITINAPSSIVVTLRGLTLEGAGIGQNGIILGSSAPGTLNIIDCVVKDFATFGIAITPDFSGSEAATNVLIANSFVLNNAGGGIEIFPLSIPTFVNYSIDHTTVAGNGTSPGNGAGILVNSSSGFLSGTISSAQIHGNNIGVNIIGNGFTTGIILRNSALTGNIGNDLVNNSSGIVPYLLDSNQIDVLSNMFTINSDGTNDILAPVQGNALTPFSRQ